MFEPWSGKNSPLPTNYSSATTTKPKKLQNGGFYLWPLGAGWWPRPTGASSCLQSRVWRDPWLPESDYSLPVRVETISAERGCWQTLNFFSFSLTVEISWSVFDDSCQFLTDGIKTLHSLVAMNELKPKIHLLLDSSFSKKNIGALSFKAKSNLPRFFQSIFECCKVARVSCHFHKERQTWKQRGREWINKNRTRWLCKRQNSGWPQRPLL